MRKSILICCCIFMLYMPVLMAQTVIISDDSTYTSGQASAVLDLYSTGKGFLMPRLTAAQKTAITAPATGLMIYQTDEIAGYYYWTGTRWEPLVTGVGGLNVVAKTASDTILKTETLVLASNDITLSLPSITAADNGLRISVKNIGSHKDLVKVKSLGTATIDGTNDSAILTRWVGKTFLAYNGNWVIQEKDTKLPYNNYEISSKGSFTTIREAIEFLSEHMTGATTLNLASDVFYIDSTHTINLPYPLSIIGANYGGCKLAAVSGLAGKPMFNCISETYFKIIDFDATTLSSYGSQVNEDAIWLSGEQGYYEIKDMTFTGFNKGVVLKNELTLWVFEGDFNDIVGTGIEIAAGSATKPVLKLSETDFTGCTKAIGLVSGINATVSVSNCGFYPTESGDVCLDYVPATFAPYTSLYVTNNTWNGTGSFLSGFDFTRTDGRDADCFIQNNAGEMDHNPACQISVVNNNTNSPTPDTWNKAVWTNTSSITSNWKIENNLITYLSKNKRGVAIFLTGNLSVSLLGNVSVVIVKNGDTNVRYGETTVRVSSLGQPFQFATVVYLQNIQKNDYLEVYFSGPILSSVKFQDIQWLTESK